MQGRVADVLGSGISPAPQNRAIVLEVDQSRQRDLRRWLLVFAVLIAAAAFDGLQRFGIVSYGIRVEQVQQLRDAEDAVARHLHLEIASLREPARIERLATRDLRLVVPGLADTRVIERIVPPDQPPSSVVASR
ncbi:MAG TPA: cell division protein FtsL [Vicinamibacterales bacterium]|nr:cell division protein FtsL [Vicinamibacterales bacterium]